MNYFDLNCGLSLSFSICRIRLKSTQSIQAAITKYHRLYDLNNRNVFLIALEAAKSKIKALADSVSNPTCYLTPNSNATSSTKSSVLIRVILTLNNPKLSVPYRNGSLLSPQVTDRGILHWQVPLLLGMISGTQAPAVW